MQAIIEHIFEKLGGPTAIATGTGCPVQTVHSWVSKKPAEIPPWRRAAVLDFARRDGKLVNLSDEARAYLASPDRTVRQAAAA
jgi:hypothetical protein